MLTAKEFKSRACKAIWDIKGIYATSRHIPGVKFAGVSHPGLIGTAPSHELLAEWNRREGALIAAHAEAVPPVAFPGMRLSPDVYADMAGNRASYFPAQRTISDFRDNRPSSTTGSSARLPGRQRVNSTNAVNELGERVGTMHLKTRTTGSGTPPHSR